ncbi:uncharacterized protein TNCV_2619251 [Trichonephila clavipes]|uniref:Uncharacterized protein n=1 Tax=Trichonephila clavipes TaxID=2585209 RepID=A0A8X6WIK0_TRICX|nr:uncharacterized protein TNCV_2619251 [Trichonephila clavipes]
MHKIGLALGKFDFFYLASLQSTNEYRRNIGSTKLKKMGKQSEKKNDANVATEEKLNRLKDSIKGTLTSAKFSSATGNRSVAANLSKGLKLFDDNFVRKISFTEPDFLMIDDFFIQGFVKSEMKKKVTYKLSVQIGTTCQSQVPFISHKKAKCYLIKESSLDTTMKKFFGLESLPDDSKEITKSEEEIYCEEHFVRTYKRDKTGRFIVRLPKKENSEPFLG